MALIAPVAFAAAGGLLSGGATWGMAAGWLIGSWLFGPKAENENKVFDPGAEELPRFNQALRGSTVPILFGTNRVSSQIVWTNNFTTIRNESKSSSGGGKGGGSGMGSKGGQPSSSEVTYEYKWDIMFHLGMSDQNVDVIGAWLVSEPINGNTIAAILAGSDSQWATFTGLTNGQEGADLNFEDSYFHGAGATGGTFANWSHFETVTGGGYRWPYTAYVGFKQLHLGNSSAVPQITWEVAEGGLSFTANSSVLGKGDQDDLYAYGGSISPYGGFLRARDGSLVPTVLQQRYASPLQTIGLVRTSDNTTFFPFSDVQVEKDAFDAFWGGSFALSSTLARNQTPIEDRYILTIRNSWTGVGGDKNFECLLWEVLDANGNVECVGSARFGDPGLSSYYQSFTFNGIANAGTDDDVMFGQTILDGGVGSSLHFNWFMPSINDMKNGVWYLDGSDDIIVRGDYFQGTPGLGDPLGNDFLGPNYNSYMHDFTQYGQGFILPKITIGLGITYESEYYFFVSRCTCQWHLDNPGSGSTFVETQAATYPNGFVFKITGMAWTAGDGTTGSAVFDDSGIGYEIVNDKFVDTAGTQVMPFDDDGYTEAGVEDDSVGYIEGVQHQKLRTGFGAGGELVVFWKTSNAAADHNVYGGNEWNTRARIFIYNPITQVFTQYVNVGGNGLSDLSGNFGITGNLYDGAQWPNGQGATAEQPGGYFDDVTNTLWFSVYLDDGGIQTLEVEAYGKFGDLSIGGGTDLTPPVIIYRILTSPIYGLGISESDIDQTSYGLANQYCESENIKVSVQYRREESALAAIDELLGTYGGFLIDSGGKIKFGIQEFNTSPIRAIDNNNLRIDQDGEPPVTITKGARQDTYNRIKVNYFDRNLAYRQNFIEIGDEVDQDINGVRAQEFPAKFVMSEATAQKIATRALWGNMYARDIYDFKLGSKDADLEPGDVITLVDSYHTELQGGVQARIVQWQETNPLTFQVRAVEEVEYVNASTLAADSVTEATSNTIFSKAQPVADFGMYELPSEFQGADAKLYVGYRQQMKAMGARLYLSADGVSYALADQAEPYIISGIMAQGIPAREPGYIEENLEVYLMPDALSSGSFSTSSPLYAQNHALDDVSAAGRALATGGIWINSEMMAYEGVNLLGQNHYRFDKLYRGWGGTHIQGHSSGDTWWKHGGGIFAETFNADKIGTIIYYKVTNYNFAGQEYPVSSVDARTYQILGTFFRPQVQAPIATYVQSPGSYLTIQSEDLGFIQKKQVVAGGSPVQLEWPAAAQEAGYGAQGYGVGGYGRFTQDTTSVQYRVEVLSSNLTSVVRCTTVDTTAFLYTSALNSEDWTGWNGSFAVRVTPYNPYGTALRSRTKILELFE